MKINIEVQEDIEDTVVIIKCKEHKDTLKNKEVLIQFVMFPLLSVIMVKAIKIEGMPENFFVTLFASMYTGMAPLTCISAIISEEKEKNTLRVLMMADVTPWQYLLGTGGYVFTACMLGGAVFCGLFERVTLQQKGLFLLIMAAGIIASVMMIFSFLPMLSMFNDKIEKIARFTYTEQIRILVGRLGNGGNCVQNVVIIFLNIVVSGGIFFVLYRRRGLV